MGRDHISKGVSQLLKESPGGEAASAKATADIMCYREIRRSCAWSTVNQGQLGRRPSQKASRGQDDAGPSRPKGLGLNSGGAVRGRRVEGHDLTWIVLSILWRRDHNGGKGGSNYKQKTK